MIRALLARPEWLAFPALALAAAALTRFGPALPPDGADRPIALLMVAVLPALLWLPALGWARRISPGETALQLGLDAVWLGAIMAWLDVALAREAGLRGAEAAWAQLALAALWAGAGAGLARRARPVAPPSRPEAVGVGLVLLAVAGLAYQRAADLVRPLDAGWYAAGADEEAAPAQVTPVGWAEVAPLGEADLGAYRISGAGAAEAGLQAGPEGAQGRLVLAVRGPLGSAVEAEGRRAEVAAEMTEDPSEGPVRRYLRAGVAALVLDVDLGPQERLAARFTGDALYVLPGAAAIWELHAQGVLRYVHYYQLLNQVENQVWAEEVLTDRWLTLNQPPGWSPLLAVASLWIDPDLPGANAIFLWVLVVVGCHAVRLLVVAAPGAPASALVLPAALVAAHGLLMIEPGSTNFPDSLYTAALLALWTALLLGRARWVAGAIAAAVLLRYAGAGAALAAVIAWRAARGRWPDLRPLVWAGAALCGGALAFAALGHMPDAAFILWFETVPEHWHGDFDPSSLLPRIPEFYGLWLRYTGYAPLLALPFAWGPATAARRSLRFLLGGALGYSAILATVDHFPSHYFLPLVAIAGPILAAAAATASHRVVRVVLPLLGAVGVGIFLWTGVV